MSSELVVEFANGKKLILGGNDDKSGLQEASRKRKIKSATSEEFNEAMGTLGELVGSMDQSLDKLDKKPSKIEMEFGASLTADCNLWIVSGEGKAEFKVKLTWEKE